MRRTAAPANPIRSTLVLLAILLMPFTARAQDYSGTGPQATELFQLPQGLAVFEFTHEGPSRFEVRLLDAEGRLTGELVRVSGAFTGSRALRIEHAGRYLLDVSATGPWTIRLRDVGSAGSPADSGPPATTRTGRPSELTEATRAREAGEKAAGRASKSWGLRGLLGGTLAGPLGLGLSVHYAGRSSIAVPPSPSPADAVFSAAFREGFESRTRTVRRKSAFVGGMVGTAIFTTVILYLADFSGDGGSSGGNDGGSPPILGIVR